MVVRSIESIDSRELNALLDAIYNAYGYDFRQYAEASIKRRSLYFMNARKLASVSELAHVLLQDEALFEEFVHNVSVTVTEMFRDPEFYACLRSKVVPRLATYPFIKIWVAGCATGEEVYSVAIMLREENLLERSLIYATDINQRSLQIARAGIYPMDVINLYAQNYEQAGGGREFSEYYVAKYNTALFDKALSENVVFAPHNLATDQSFNEFHLILCRNVLIYFNQQLQNRVMNLFYDSLCTFGILGLGNKESLLFTQKQGHYGPVSREQKIFIKTV